MLRIIAVYGLIAGVVVAVPMIVMLLIVTPEGVPEHGELFGYASMLLALTAVFIGIKHYRDKILGGAIGFGPALLVGLGISLVASLLYVAGWEIALSLSHFDFAQAYAKSMVEQARAKGASAAQLKEVSAAADAVVRIYAHPLQRMGATFVELFPLGVLVSLVSAALLRNSRLLPARPRA